MGITAEVGKSAGKRSFLSFLGFLRFIRKHWYLFIFLAIILPSMIVSIQHAFQEKNPLIPIFDLAKRIFASDIDLKNDVAILENNPSELIGMNKPTVGIYFTVKFYWLIFWNVFYKLFGSVWLIFLPAVVTYKILIRKNTSEVYKAVLKTAIIFLLYLFIVNSIFTIHSVVTGQMEINIPIGLSPVDETLFIAKQLIPLNGLFSLIIYIIGLFTGKYSLF